MLYTLFKSAHVTCAFASYLLFVTRGVWIFRNPDRSKPVWVGVLPHFVDSLLLASAIGLVVVTRQYPGDWLWLDVKIACLLLYIGLGMAAFRFCRSQRSKITAWILAAVATSIFVAFVLSGVLKA